MSYRNRGRRNQWDEELAWFFESAEGALGLRAAPLEGRTGGSGQEVREPDEAELAAAARWRRVHAALERLTSEQRRVLWLAHAGIPRELRARLGRLGDLMLVVLYVDASLDALGTARSRGTAVEARVARARAEAEWRVVDAIAAYQAARRGAVIAAEQGGASGSAAVRLRRFFGMLGMAAPGASARMRLGRGSRRTVLSTVLPTSATASAAE